MLFGSEFGRLPTAQRPDGRDHNIMGYSMFLAGAGVKGYTGATDSGIKAVEGHVRTNDLHATLLALMGLNPRKADLSLCWPRCAQPDRCRRRSDGARFSHKAGAGALGRWDS